MSRKQKIKHMSSDELKSKLYAHFQKSGSLDHLRSQLRGQLVSELFKVAEPMEPDKFPSASDVEKCLLPLQVCNWLVYDHLSRQDYQYSLSTFVTEARLPYPEKFLTAGDILGLLGLNHNPSDFDNISKLYSENNELGYLHSLLLAIIKILFNVPNRELTLNQSGEAKSEAVGDASFPIESPQFKQMNLNKSFLTNNDAIKSADVSFHEQLQNVKEENERTVQKLRHKLLHEIENLHSQECKMQREIEYTKSELRKEQNRLLKEKEMLQEKEVLMEKEIENKFELKMRDVESDFASKLHFRDKEIESLKLKVLEKDQKLTHVETELESEKDNFILLKRELEDLKHMYKIIQDKYSFVLDENTNILKKFESMSDYTILKEELATKSHEMTRLQTEIKDIHQKSEAERRKYVETVRKLEDNLSIKESQLTQAREEMEYMRNSLSKEQSIWNKERKRLEQELFEFKEINKTLMQRMEDQSGEIQDLQKTVHILNYKLTNNVISTARSESFGACRNLQRTLISQNSKQESLFTKRNRFLQQPPEKYDDSSLQFISDAKSKISKLKKEENAVQEKYSFIFSTIPEHKHESYFENFNLVSLTKNDTGNYTFPKPVSSTSSYNLGNWSDNKLPTYTKNAYSLSDSQSRIMTSQFPYETPQTAFQTGISDFDLSSQVPNRSTMLKDTLKVQSSYSHSNQYGFIEPDKDISMLNAKKHGNSFDKEGSEDSQKEKLQNKEVNKTVLGSNEHNKTEKLVVSNQNKLQRDENINDSRKSSLLLNSNKTLSDMNKNAIPSLSENFGVSSELQKVGDQNNTDVSEAKTHFIQSSQEVHAGTSKIIENEPESSSSVFVNLDAAWKKRSSIPSLSYRESEIVNRTNLKEKSDSLLPTSVTSVSKTMFDTAQDTHDRNIVQPENKQDSDHVSHKSIQGTDNITIKENAANASNVLQNEDKEARMKDIAEKELAFDEVTKGKISTVDKSIEMTQPKYTEEQDNPKSTEKIASADSLSEISEIHLSYGSEAEQQKEDSDAW